MALQVDGELEALLENGEGLSDKNQVLSLSRLMVRIETLEQKLTCLKLIQVRSGLGREGSTSDILRGAGGVWEAAPALFAASPAQLSSSRIHCPSVLFPSMSCSAWSGPAAGSCSNPSSSSHSSQLGPAQGLSSGSAMALPMIPMEQFSMFLPGSV